MKIVEPGHLYVAQAYAAREADGKPVETALDLVRFRKRIGDGYAPNQPPAYAGTSTQELLRIIIDRSKYVQAQKTHTANIAVIDRAQRSIWSLEDRAAYLRGEEYQRTWHHDLSQWMNSGHGIEDAGTCDVCGHIFCRQHA